MTPTAPTVGVDAATGFTTVTIPNVPGISWQLTPVTADPAGVERSGTPVDVKFPAPTTGKGAKAPTSMMYGGSTAPFDPRTIKVRIVARADSAYVFSTAKGPVVSGYVFPIKARATVVEAATGDKVVSFDNPGSEDDYVEVTGMVGVDWSVDGKKLAVRPGAVAKVARNKSLSSVTVSGMPAVGYTWRPAGGSTIAPASVTYLRIFAGDVPRTLAPTVSGLVATLPLDPGLKSWSFTPDGGKATPIAAPTDAGEVQVLLSGSGVLTATPQPGYALTSRTGVAGSAGTWTWPVVG